LIGAEKGTARDEHLLGNERKQVCFHRSGKGGRVTHTIAAADGIPDGDTER
jgi:hypothetical protein